MSRGLERPPVWFWPLAVVAVVLLAVGIPFAVNRASGPTPAQAASANAAITSARASESAAEAAARPIQVLIIGDSYTAGSGEGGTGDKSWAALLESRLTSEGQAVVFTLAAVGGSGYTTVGTGDTTFAQRVAVTPGDWDLVVFFGSRNDGGVDEATVEQDAADAYAAERAASPDAQLLVVGPPWVDDNVPAGIRAARDGVSQAAAAAGATFVDPISDGWFFGPNSALIGGDNVHPTDDGHAYMADLMYPAFTPLLTTIRADIVAAAGQ